MEQLNLNLTLNQNGSVTARWSPISGTVRYEAFMYPVNEHYAIYSEKNLTGTSYTSKSNLDANRQYEVIVTAYGQHAVITSEGKKILIPSDFYRNQPLDVPQNVKATADTSSVTVSFSAVSRATGYDILFDNKVYSVTSTSRKFTGLTPKSRHTYAVRAKNSNVTGAYSSTQAITTAAQMPAVPSNVKKTATETSVTISWGAVSGATDYELDFNGVLYQVYGTSRTFSGLTAGTSYPFAVRSHNADGYSAYTQQATVTTAPLAPSRISMETNEDSVTVSWSPVTGAASYDLLFNNKAYHVEGISYTITGLTANTSYSCRIRANSADGSSAYNSALTVKTAPMPPAPAAASAGKNSVTLSWNAVNGAASYDVLFADSVYRVYGTSHTVTGLRPGVSYTYQIRSNNGDSSSSYSTPKTITTIPDPPEIPASVSASATGDSVTISWGAVAGATSYDILMDNKTYNSVSTSKTITGLKPDTVYTYYVRANNAGGSGTYSSANTIRTLTVPLTVPANVRASAQTYSVTVSWNAVSGATGYDLVFNGTVYSETGTSRTIMGLGSGTSYSYRVRAKNSGGTGAYSETHTIRTLTPSSLPPAPPSNIRAVATLDTITISWNAVSGATGYRVTFDNVNYRLTGTSKVFTGLKPDTPYNYCVRSINSGGIGPSGYGNKIRTLRPGPGMPSDITAMATMDCVILSWSPVEGADSYDIQFDGTDYHVTESGTASYTARNRSQAKMYKIFAGLKPNTEYGYCARANNVEGSSLYTPLKYVRTDIRKSGGLAQGGSRRRTYPDGRRTYTGNDPVNALTGAFLWSYTWLEDHGKDGLHFTAMYDSRRDAKQGVLGRK